MKPADRRSPFYLKERILHHAYEGFCKTKEHADDVEEEEKTWYSGQCFRNFARNELLEMLDVQGRTSRLWLASVTRQLKRELLKEVARILSDETGSKSPELKRARQRIRALKRHVNRSFLFGDAFGADTSSDDSSRSSSRSQSWTLSICPSERSEHSDGSNHSNHSEQSSRSDRSIQSDPPQKSEDSDSEEHSPSMPSWSYLVAP